MIGGNMGLKERWPGHREHVVHALFFSRLPLSARRLG